MNNNKLYLQLSSNWYDHFSVNKTDSFLALVKYYNNCFRDAVLIYYTVIVQHLEWNLHE